MKKWDIGLWSLFLLILLFIFLVMYEIMYLYHRANVLTYYIGILVVEIMFYILVSMLLKKTHIFHFHHYAIAMTALSLVCY
jgi:hypothetical protein